MEPISRNLLPTNSLEVPFLTVKQEGLILQACKHTTLMGFWRARWPKMYERSWKSFTQLFDMKQRPARDDNICSALQAQLQIRPRVAAAAAAEAAAQQFWELIFTAAINDAVKKIRTPPCRRCCEFQSRHRNSLFFMMHDLLFVLTTSNWIASC